MAGTSPAMTSFNLKGSCASRYASPRPGEEHGREIRRIAAFPVTLRMRRWRSGLWLNDTTIKMPRRMAEDWHDDRQAQEQRE